MLKCKCQRLDRVPVNTPHCPGRPWQSGDGGNFMTSWCTILYFILIRHVCHASEIQGRLSGIWLKLNRILSVIHKMSVRSSLLTDCFAEDLLKGRREPCYFFSLLSGQEYKQTSQMLCSEECTWLHSNDCQAYICKECGTPCSSPSFTSQEYGFAGKTWNSSIYFPSYLLLSCLWRCCLREYVITEMKLFSNAYDTVEKINQGEHGKTRWL